MSAFFKKLLPFLLLFVFWSCGAPDYVKYWADHKKEYKQLTEYSEFLFHELGITELNKNGIWTKAQKHILYADIKSEYPKHSKKISNIIERLKKLNAQMLIGVNYCSFFVKSGGALSSDEWLLFTETEAGFEAFKKDNSKWGYAVISKDILEKNWYFIVTD